jgi:hypothetical protein
VAVDVAAEFEVVDVAVLLVEDPVLEAETMVEVDPAAALPEVVPVSLAVTKGMLVLKGMVGVGWLKSRSQTRSHSLYQAVLVMRSLRTMLSTSRL